MTTFAVVLKDEIRRLARKEVKAHTSRTSKAVAQYRRQIAALKRLVHEQDRRISSLQKLQQERKDSTETAVEPKDSTRFSARSVKAQRRRTGLSAADYARLVGVSPLTIYNWENGKSRPRSGQFVTLVALRGLGKREARAKLEELAVSQRGGGRRRTRRRPK